MNRISEESSAWASPSPPLVCITMPVPCLLLLPQCSLAEHLYGELPRLAPCAAAQTAALVQENCETQITISSQATGWGRGKKWSWYSASNHSTQTAKTNLVCRDAISISWEGKDTAHEMEHLEEVICYPIMTSNASSAAFPVNLLSFGLRCVVEKKLTGPLTHIWKRGLSRD